MKMEVLWGKMAVLGEGEAEKTKSYARDVREIEKFLKTVWDLTQCVQKTFFPRLIWLATELPKSLEQDFKKKIL